jgi:hypothetical protein
MLIASTVVVVVALAARITTPVDGGCDLACGSEMLSWTFHFFFASDSLIEHAEEFVDVPVSERRHTLFLPFEKSAAPLN